MAGELPVCLKPVKPYFLLSKQFKKRDVVISYYAAMFAVQEGLSVAKGDHQGKAYLVNAMDSMEEMKCSASPEKKEIIASDIVSQSHIEAYAFGIFSRADNADRAAQFSKDLVKLFLTAAHLFTILKQFGELSDEIEEKMKYAKWKAVELEKCLRLGITPTPGPPGGDEASSIGPDDGAMGGHYPPPPSDPMEGTSRDFYPPQGDRPVPKPRHNTPSMPPGEYNQPNIGFNYDGVESDMKSPPSQGGGAEVSLGPDEIAKAQKFCKFASSSLDYDDITGAIEFLSKALNLLKTGKEES